MTGHLAQLDADVGNRGRRGQALDLRGSRVEGIPRRGAQVDLELASLRDDVRPRPEA